MKIEREWVLDLFRGAGRCEWCGFAATRLEPHHIFTRGAGRLDIPVNLIALCAVFTTGNNCHVQAQHGKITRFDLLAVVAAREGVLQDDIELEIYRLRRLPQGSDYGVTLLRPNGDGTSESVVWG